LIIQWLDLMRGRIVEELTQGFCKVDKDCRRVGGARREILQRQA
jgi:hypothetical protein